ncbi:MAG: tetratricopeptide repeat protein [Burkholderiales bacterium]|nr:tetratricopeptide repeat protein [Burkholderiales bacterium]
MTVSQNSLRALSAVLVCASAFVLSAGAARADDLQEAARLLKAGQHAQALERVNRVLAAKPRDPQARFLKGLIFTEQGNHKEALDIFLKLTQDYPQLPEPYNNLAVLYAAQGQYDKARAALEQSIRTHPTYATAYENLGDVYAKLASQAYDKALQLDSSNAAAKNKLALVRELVGPPARPVAAAAAAPTKTPAPAVAPAPASAPAPAEAKAPVAPSAAPSPAAEAKAAEPGAAAQVLETVNAWARAWSAKDADAYLAFYAPGFRTPAGEPREQWEKTRRQRIAAPKSITVSVGSPKVTLHGEDRASVTFRQTYRSDLVNATSTKTLVLVKANGRWMIQEERVVN